MSSKKSDPEKSETQTPPLELKREEDFTTKYASHVATEPSGWDLKLVFGQVDTSVGPNAVSQHTAILLSWPTVKSLVYLLRLQLASYEANIGHVPFPVGGMGPIPRSIPEGFRKFAKAKEIHKAALKLYDEFVADNPEAFPKEEPGE